ncbi:MAG TPA: glycoside hydrolase family 3 N-terminal domain-containing protein, partial [Chitinophagaceae bacterium]|nr:glycoside hydrolase family 3 N-terminal domain-containing protein [Chitinophagaceae bacterium]
MKNFLFLFLLLPCSISFGQSNLAYKNSDLLAKVRAKDLLDRMTPKEKFWQLFMIPGDLSQREGDMFKKGIFGLQVSATSEGDAAGQMLDYHSASSALAFAQKLNKIQRFFVEKTRLGIPVIFFEEAVHGLVTSNATVFPQAIGLAATFDTSLMRNVAQTIVKETKVRGIRQVLSPVINLASDVRWGRVEETYGEDPFLSATMASVFVNSFENNGIITTPKHFVANVGAGGRDSYPIYYNKRHLAEYDLIPFKAAFNQGAQSVMTSYNSVNGQPSSANSWLLQNKLKEDWNFDGFVISDASAVGGDVVLLHTAKDYAEAGMQAINNGLDVIFQTRYNQYKLFIPPFLDGRIDTNRINNAVMRVLTAKFNLGLFDHPYVSLEAAKKLMRDSSGTHLAKKASLESIVLLKNNSINQTDKILPLDNKKINNIAIIGYDADTARLGDYSGTPTYTVSMLEGIKNRASQKDIQVSYAAGVPIMNQSYHVVASKYLTDLRHHTGLTASYYNNINLSGSPDIQKNVKNIDFLWTLSLPDQNIKTDFYSARWEGTIHSPKTGNFQIGLKGDDGFRLYINNQLVIDNWRKVGFHTKLSQFHFEKGKEYKIKIEFFEPVGNGQIKLIWNVGLENNWKQKIQEAVKTAKKADVALIAAGIHEGEFQDRADLSLPGHQIELINAVAKTGTPIVVILIGGSAITMNKWIDQSDAILDIWYPGEQGGNAIA